MKVMTSCMKCTFDTKEVSLAKFLPIHAELNSEGFYEVECPRGHKSILWIQNDQFEILFDSAVLAILDGYSREAVSSFAASLERFYEFCIRVIQSNNEIDQNEFEKVWKSMSRQSERQLGAFYMAYLSEFKKAPPIIENKWMEFRNRVIHKGSFPSAIETLMYGEYIYNYMIEILLDLKTKCPIGFHEPAVNKIRSYSQKNETNIQITTVGLATCINILALDGDKKTFEEVVESFKRMYKLQYSK